MKQAGEARRVARGLTNDLGAAMGANIEKGPDLSVFAPGHHERSAGHHDRAKIEYLCDLAFVANPDP